MRGTTVIGMLLFALGLYGVVVALVYVNQSGLLFLPHMPGRELTATPARLGLEYTDVQLVTDDAVRLHGWWVRAPRARGTLLFFHGNAGNISHRLDSIQLFSELGLDVLIIDYRGYGRSDGTPSERGTYRDALAAWNWLTHERKVPPERILLFGRSLGAAVAVDLALKVRSAGLIVESAFTSVPDLAGEIYPFLPVRQMSRYQYDSLSKIGRIAQPLLLVHSRDDELIGFRHGQRLFEAASQPKEFVQIRGGHNDGFLLSAEDYRHPLRVFLDRVLPVPEPAPRE